MIKSNNWFFITGNILLKKGPGWSTTATGLYLFCFTCCFLRLEIQNYYEDVYPSRPMSMSTISTNSPVVWCNCYIWHQISQHENQQTTAQGLWQGEDQPQDLSDMLKTVTHFNKEIMKNIDNEICKDILKDIRTNFDIYEACVELYLPNGNWRVCFNLNGRSHILWWTR